MFVSALLRCCCAFVFSATAACGSGSGAPPDEGDAGFAQEDARTVSSHEDASGGSADVGGGGDGGDGLDAAGADGAAMTPGARVFDTTVLHQIAITVENQHLEALDNDLQSRVPCTVTFDGVTIVNAGIRKKGMSSIQPLDGKPSFSLKLNEFVPGQELDGLKKIILNNNSRDPTFLSEHLTYEMYRLAGQPAPFTSHAVVVFNGETKGFYIVKEAVNNQFMSRNFGKEYNDGNLYEGPWDFTRGAAAAELKDEVEEMRTRADLEALTDVVMNTPDAELVARLTPLLDLDQFIATFAIDMAFNVWDGYAVVAWNFYLYNHPRDSRFLFIPHGADWPYWHADFDPYDLFTDPWNTGDPPGYLAVRAREIAELDAQFRSELDRVITQVYDVPHLETLMDEAARVVRTAPRSDPVLSGELDEFEANVDSAYAFVRERKMFLESLP